MFSQYKCSRFNLSKSRINRGRNEEFYEKLETLHIFFLFSKILLSCKIAHFSQILLLACIVNFSYFSFHIFAAVCLYSEIRFPSSFINFFYFLATRKFVFCCCQFYMNRKLILLLLQCWGHFYIIMWIWYFLLKIYAYSDAVSFFSYCLLFFYCFLVCFYCLHYKLIVLCTAYFMSCFIFPVKR